MASKIKKDTSHVYVLMGDGEQQKGQIGEARRLAKKFGLSNITAIVDYNKLQISGNIEKVMPQNIIENFLSDDWEIIEINGHDYNEIYAALKTARNTANPVCIIANTVMGNGISFMENKEKYHGSPSTRQSIKRQWVFSDWKINSIFIRKNAKAHGINPSYDGSDMTIDAGTAFTYNEEDKIDNRSAFGKALKDLGDKNIQRTIGVCL